MSLDLKKIPVKYAVLQSSMAFPSNRISEVTQISKGKTPTLKAYLTPVGLWLENKEGKAIGMIPTTNIKGMEFEDYDLTEKK